MPKYRILPVESDEIIKAEDAGDALINFATAMDSDMSTYFKAEPVEELTANSKICDLPKTLLSVTLVDSGFSGGGIDHIGETLEEFIESTDLVDESASIRELHNALLQCGIGSPLKELVRDAFHPEEITKLATLSTAHISKKTSEKLDEYIYYVARGDEFDSGFTNYPPIYKKDDYGYWVCISDSELSEIADVVPDDLFDCYLWAKRRGCEWLCLDCDGPIVVDLPVYEH